jgi:hypothetical protein
MTKVAMLVLFVVEASLGLPMAAASSAAVERGASDHSSKASGGIGHSAATEQRGRVMPAAVAMLGPFDTRARFAVETLRAAPGLAIGWPGVLAAGASGLSLAELGRAPLGETAQDTGGIAPIGATAAPMPAPPVSTDPVTVAPKTSPWRRR